MKLSFSDLVSSVRAIHQTLVLTSIALIITVVLAKPPDNISSAMKELDAVNRLTSEENWNALFLEAFYQKQDSIITSAGDDVWHQQFWNIEFQAEEVYGTRPTGRLHFAGITAPIDIFVGWDYTLLKEPSFGFHIGATPSVPRPNTILELVQVWDKSRSTRVLTVDHLKNYAYVQRSPDFPIEKVDIAVEDTSLFYSRGEEIFPGELGVFRLNLFRSEDIAPEDQGLYGLSYIVEDDYFYSHKWKIWIPAITIQGQMFDALGDSSFDATVYLCEKAGLDRAECRGPFEQVFPNLSEALRDHQNLPFRDVAAYLERQSELQMQNFDFLGLKLPIKTINIGGSILLISLQFYLLLHLMALRRVDIESSIPAWIGIFSDWLSRGTAALSIAFLPLLSIAFLNSTFISVDFSWINSSRIFLFVSAVLSTIILGEFLAMWRKIDAQLLKPLKLAKNMISRRNRNR